MQENIEAPLSADEFKEVLNFLITQDISFEYDLPFDFLVILNEAASPLGDLRKHRNFTQVQLAKLVGVSQSYLANLENGRREGSPKILNDLSYALEVPLDLVFALSVKTLEVATKP